MSTYAKIKAIAETMTGYDVIVDSSNGANVDFDNITFPCILILIQQSGTYNTNNSHYRDSPNIRVHLFNKITQDATNDEIGPIKEVLKTDLVTLHHKLRYNFDFKINTTELNYRVSYNEYDANLLGLIFDDKVTERVGINLACTLTPQPQTVIIVDQDGNVLGTYTQGGTYTINIGTEEMNGRYINETFTGSTITLPHTPIALTEELHVDGSLWTLNEDYTISGAVITLVNPITESSIINCPYKYL